MEKNKSNSDLVRICPRCASTNIRVYSDDSGFHFSCVDCGNPLVVEVSREEIDRLKNKSLKK